MMLRAQSKTQSTHLSTIAITLALAAFALTHSSDVTVTVHAQSACGPLVNPIVCENQKAGDPSSVWDINGSGDPSIQGFATNISVTPGQTQSFKIDTTSSNYTIPIYRMGYYGGMGARKVATISPLVAPQNQPNCLTDASTGLVDCGNWAVSANWTVPADAVSGIYFAAPERIDTGGSSHIFFVVRESDTATHRSDIVFQTSDTTWQAYNQYGGNSLYVGNPVGRAYKVSYNRPFTTRGTGAEDFVFNAEYPMVRWLESNGYDVSYMSGVDTDRVGATVLTPAKHKLFLSVGHDEYWSGAQRANVEAARGLGVHLAFFSGNEVFWKTRWENSIDGSNTPYRTLVTYKETHENAKIDPNPAWTGTWRDPRFSPPADGGKPENALTGTIFKVNSGTTAIAVPAALGKLRFWRNTSVATLAAGATATMPNGTLGYEWDEEPNNGFRPSGLMRLSSATLTNAQILLDYGSSYGTGSATHNLTLYRHPSGALVFGAGTVQWSWGLDAVHDRGNTAADVRMRQATVNLFADMGVQPATLQSGLVAATASTDSVAPVTTISSPASGASFGSGTPVTISGTATDGGGGIVTAVEVSTDNGVTWNQATGTTSWTYSWAAAGSGNVTIRSRGFDDTGNRETPSAGVTVTVTGSGTCPCSIWTAATVPPAPLDDLDTSSVELGTKFRSDVDGFVTAVRFYKGSTNTGTHTGSLWTGTGTLLGTVTFSGESASGWQQANFPTAIPINANTTYVVSYHAPNGHYTGTDPFFNTAVNNPPLHALSNGTDGPNGVYAYAATTQFPTNTFNTENYWVDVVVTTVPPVDTTPPTITTRFPAAGATNIDPAASVTATFSESMNPSTLSSSTAGGEGGSSSGTVELRDPSNSLVNAAVSYNATSKTVTLQPGASLALSTTYTVLIKGGTLDPRVKDLAGNAMTANATWSFTTAAAPPPPSSCPCSIWSPTTVPVPVDDLDVSSTVLGTKFQSDIPGFITGARFYKASANTGTHVAALWTSTGTQLASANYSGESASGWQQVLFPTPVPIAANTTYVISYLAPNGHYSGQDGYFAGAGIDNPPLHALRNGVDGPNGVYAYSSTSVFPTQTYQSEGYFVDVVFNTTNGPDVTPPAIRSVSPFADASGVFTNTSVSVTFTEPVNSTTINTSTILLRNASGSSLPATVTYNAGSNTATLTPLSTLPYSSLFTAVVKAGVKDLTGNATTADVTWSFTTSAPPPPPPTQGPGGPVLIVTSTTNPFSTYYAEILRTEGLNAFSTADLASVTSGTLGSYDVVVLGETTLSAAQVTMFTTWVNGGGNLIAMRPDKQLAGLLGLTDAAATLSNAYLLVNTSAGTPGAGIVSQTIQFHGAADRYTLNGASSLATLYSNATTATTSPAVTLRNVGAGHAVAFTFDLAKSIVYTRQGNPAWSGQERDANTPIRSDDLFFGAKAGDVQPDWTDLNKVAIPQADEQQRFLWNIVLNINANKKPLPRFWYFPRMLQAVVVMTGDDHAQSGTIGRFDGYDSVSNPGCNVANWDCIRGTSYIFPGTAITDDQVASYVARGFEIALHVNTNCSDWTPSSLASFYSTQLAQFNAAWPHAGAPTTNRTHCIVNSDYATQPQVELNNNIRLDTNYYYFPPTWIQDRPGMFTGSGMPMRFTTSTGQMIDVYQATTQMTDESGQTFPKNIDALLDNAIGGLGYYGAFTANMHTDTNGGNSEIWSTSIVNSAKARGVPVITAKQLLTWLDGRNGSTFQSMTWNGSVLSFDIAVGAGANGLQALVPASNGASPLTGIVRNGTSIAYSLQTIKGVQYAVFPAGAASYAVSYGPDIAPPTISGLSVSAVGATTATVSWTTNEPATSVVNYGTNPSALTQSASNSTLVTTRSMPLSGLTPGTTYYYRVTSTDAAGNPAISPTTDPPPNFVTTTAPPLITSASTASGTVGTAFSYQITGTNSPTSYGATGLPGGLSVSTTTGLISGTPTAAGTSTVTLTATNAGGSGSATLTLTINPAPPVITSAATASGTKGVAFSYQITATNAPTSYGATGLPAGLTVNSGTGLISGTATAAATSTVTLTATNAGGSGTATLTLTIAPALPVITSATTASGAVSAAFSYQITATNAPTSYGATGLPTGLSVNSGNGLISGIPTTAGTSTVTLSATNSDGTGNATLTLTIAPGPPVITSATTANGTAGVAFSYQITATNAPTSYGASGLPSGLSVNTGTGVISGTPTAAGTSTVTLTATNAAGPGTATLTLTIAPAPPVINSATTASGTVGTAFSYQITATNAPTSYDATGLPAGLSVNTSTGLISGTPTATGTSTVTLTATNAGGSGTATLTLTVVPPRPVITSAATANGTVGVAFSYQITATNTPTSYGATGLPAGLSVNTTTGLISGTPTAPGTSSVTISATNSGGSGNATLSITIAPIPPVITSATTASGTVGAAFSYQITASNAPTSFGATGLPAGLSVNTGTGLISGTPTAAGTSTVTLTATNAAGSGNATLTLTIAPAGPGITIDASVTFGRSTTSTTIASPAFSTTSANQLLLAFIAADNTSGTTTITNVTGAGLTWQLVRRTNAQRGTAEIWRTFAPTTLTNVTATATISQSVVASITVMSFKGVNTTGTSGSGAIGATASGSAASGAPTATLTTTRANSLIVGIGDDWDTATARTLGPNQTLVSQYLATVGDTFWVQRTTNTVPAAGTVVTINATAPTADRYNLTICEILTP